MAVFDDNAIFGKAIIGRKIEPPDPFAKGNGIGVVNG